MWPSSFHSRWPLRVFQPYTQPSSEAVSSVLPWGEKAEELTWSESTKSPTLGQETLACLSLTPHSWTSPGLEQELQASLQPEPKPRNHSLCSQSQEPGALWSPVNPEPEA